MTDPKELGEFLIAVANGRRWRVSGFPLNKRPPDLISLIKSFDKYELEPEQREVHVYGGNPDNRRRYEDYPPFHDDEKRDYLGKLTYTDDMLEKGK